MMSSSKSIGRLPAGAALVLARPRRRRVVAVAAGAAQGLAGLNVLLVTIDTLPVHNLTLIALGIALNNRKMFDDARPRLLRAPDREPDNVEALAAMAETEEGLGDLDAADRQAGRALAAAPTHPTANLVVGMVLMKRGRYAEARDALERAATADPDSPKVYYQLSLAYARLGNAAQASRHQELYQQKLRAVEARIEEIRSAGVPSGGDLHP
jgi:predicted Zn-dependent protease